MLWMLDIYYDAFIIILSMKLTLNIVQLMSSHVDHLSSCLYLLTILLCFFQLALPNAVYLVDAIEGGELLIQACKPALESTNIMKVIHDCKRDSEVSTQFSCFHCSSWSFILFTTY